MLCEKIKELRIAYNYSQKQLAAKLGVSKQSVSNWENNYIVPSIEILIRISKFFHVSTDYLLGLDDRTYVEVSGLSLEQCAHIQQIISDILK